MKLSIFGYEISITKQVKLPVIDFFHRKGDCGQMLKKLTHHARKRLQERHGAFASQEKHKFMRGLSEVLPENVFEEVPKQCLFVNGDTTFVLNKWDGKIITVKPTAHFHPRGLRVINIKEAAQVRKNLLDGR